MSRRSFVAGFVAGAAIVAFAAGYVAVLANRLSESIINMNQTKQPSILANSGFEEIGPAVAGSHLTFPGWADADFWNNQLATGFRKRAVGVESNGALELVLTDAAASGFHIGVQQNCGEYRANTWLSISVNMNVPNLLTGSVASVAVVIYPPSTQMAFVMAQMDRSEPTSGWQRYSASVRVPTEVSTYSCIVIIHLIASQPLAHVSHVAQFDNVVLSVGQ
jgi:hypothetical protein